MAIKKYYIFTDGGAFNNRGEEGKPRVASGGGIILDGDIVDRKIKLESKLTPKQMTPEYMKNNFRPDSCDEEIIKGFSILKEDQTNQYGELKSAVIAFRHMVKMLDTNEQAAVIFYSDSKFVIQGITEWIHGWRRGNKWTNSKNEPVAHKELWQELWDLTHNKQIKAIQFMHLRGHQKNLQYKFPHRYNFYVDALCVKRLEQWKENNGF